MKNTNALDAMVVLQALKKSAAPTINRLTDLEIKTVDDYSTAGKFLKTLKGKVKEATLRKKEMTDPLKDVISKIQSHFKPFETVIKALEDDTKSKMLYFQSAQEKKSAALEQSFEDGKIKKVSTLISKQAALEVMDSFSQTRNVWTAIEVDATKTPREFMVPDMVKIRAALKDGKKVTGWSWEQIKSIAI